MIDMTVQELIDKLNEIEDKDMTVDVWDSTNQKWTDRFDLYPQEKTLWDSTGYYRVNRICLDFVKW